MAAIPAALNAVRCPALTGGLVVVAVPLLDDDEEGEEEELAQEPSSLASTFPTCVRPDERRLPETRRTLDERNIVAPLREYVGKISESG